MSQCNQSVNCVCYKAGVVKFPNPIGYEAVPYGPLRTGNLSDFIAYTVHEHAWMVIVFIHKGYYILFPVVSKIYSIVVSPFRRIPCITQFIQNKNPQPVARIQKRPGRRVMRYPYRIEACFFPDFHTTFFCASKRCRPQNTIVVMVASASQFNRQAIQPQAVYGVNSDGSNAKGLLNGIKQLILFIYTDMAGI